MENTINWVSIINIVGFVNGIFFSLLVLGVKKTAKTPRYLLAALLLTLSLTILASFFWTTRFYMSFPHFLGILPNMVFLIGPLLYLYIKATIHSDFVYKKFNYLHFIPFGLVMPPRDSPDLVKG